LNRVIPRKRFGQHFLKDKNVLDRIVERFAPGDNQIIAEIGPGTGALTERLLDRVNHLAAVELDRDLAAALQRKHPPERLTVIQEDILNFNIRSLLPDDGEGDKVRLIGNLPYNISTPLLFHLLKSVDHVEDMVFMLQKEVAQRLSAAPGSKIYGRLTVMAALKLECHPLFDVPPNAFDPPPKVNSTVLHLTPRIQNREIRNQSRLDEIVRCAFSQRRKTLRNSLQNVVNDAQFEAAGIDSSRRAETLSVQEFIGLGNV
jgi:16S rRNA (adenine1518-N6/adenine1519-N6)-dimethyltransferase